MREIKFPYGKGTLSYDFEKENLLGVMTSHIEEYEPELEGRELVRKALDNPIGSKKLSELAKGKKKVVIIASDHTRPVPSKVIIPPMLREIRAGNPEAEITILIATGCHRGTTKGELVDKFGADIVEKENIVIHDCDDAPNMVHLGTLPSGGALMVNRLAVEADLLVSEGFIEPHFFAGFSGGRKSVLPGVVSRQSVLANHCSEFIADPNARTGSLDQNPIHRDMLWAAQTAKLAFIVNVVLNEHKEVIYAVAGDVAEAHKKGCAFLSGLCRVKPAQADIVISTNGGYPLDQNIYQAVKGMTAAEATVKEGGVIIMLAKSNDGHGGDHFYHQLADEADIGKTMALFLSRGRNETVPDQWQTQILIRIMQRATILYLSDAPDELIRDLHMVPIHSIEEGLKKAEEILNNPNATVTAIPDGVSVIVSE